MSSQVIKDLSNYPEVSFIESTSFIELQEKMINDYVTRYRELTGIDAQLAAADPNRLILYACAVAIYQGYQYEDKAGKMGLLKYSTGEYLDNLASMKGVVRNEAKPSQTTVRFSLSTTLSKAAIVPTGTRVKGMDLYFETAEQGEIPAGQQYADLTVFCQTLGNIGNGYAAGEVKTLVDPLPYTLSVENTVPTFGGADRENDTELAERIYLAPSSYSTAGPQQAYEYWVKTYNSKISECNVISEAPGEVDIYITLSDGEKSDILPTDGFIAELTDSLKSSNVRPLTDHVVVKKPEVIKYAIDFTYYPRLSDHRTTSEIETELTTAAENYAAWQRHIGRPINPDQLHYELMKVGLHSVKVAKPEYTELTNSQIPLAETMDMHFGERRNG